MEKKGVKTPAKKGQKKGAGGRQAKQNLPERSEKRENLVGVLGLFGLEKANRFFLTLGGGGTGGTKKTGGGEVVKRNQKRKKHEKNVDTFIKKKKKGEKKKKLERHQQGGKKAAHGKVQLTVGWWGAKIGAPGTPNHVPVGVKKTQEKKWGVFSKLWFPHTTKKPPTKKKVGGGNGDHPNVPKTQGTKKKKG